MSRAFTNALRYVHRAGDGLSNGDLRLSVSRYALDRRWGDRYALISKLQVLLHEHHQAKHGAWPDQACRN